MEIKRYAIRTGRFSVADMDDAREDDECGAWVTYETADLLRKQLAARDAAIDAVLALLTDNSTISESTETRMFRERCLMRLAANGVHPK